MFRIAVALMLAAVAGLAVAAVAGLAVAAPPAYSVAPLVYYQAGQLYSYTYSAAPVIDGSTVVVCFTSDLKTAKCSYRDAAGVDSELAIRLKRSAIGY
jgi:type IV secretory pathway protease TraF